MLATAGRQDMADNIKKKSVREKVEDILAIWRGIWGRYDESDDEDIDEEEEDPRFRSKWKIGLSDDDVRQE